MRHLCSDQFFRSGPHRIAMQSHVVNGGVHDDVRLNSHAFKF